MTPLVVSVGNPHAGDDGAGPAAAELVRRRTRGTGLRVEDLHTDILALERVWRGERRVFILDAMVRGAPPGTIHRLDHRELLELPQHHAHVHALSLPECLRWLLLARPQFEGVEFSVWGIEPGRLAAGRGLSTPVAAAVRRVAGEVLARIGPAVRSDLPVPCEAGT